MSWKPLTTDELDIVKLIIRGWGNKAIANELGLAGPTIKNKVGRICRKMRCENRVQIAVLAVRGGI